MGQLHNTAKVLTALFDENTAATHEIVALTAGKRMTVYEVYLAAAGANDVTWKSNTTILLGPVGLTAGNIMHIPAGTLPFCSVASGEALNLTLSAAARVTGWVKYTIDG